MAETVVYEGDPGYASLLARTLQDEGVQVTYRPPMEYRGAGEVPAAIVVYLVEKVADQGVGIVVSAAVSAAIAKFRRQVPNAKVEYHPDEPEPE